MSRSWERAVRKNTKTINQRRKKTGTPLVGEPDGSTIRGRNWMLASMMLMISIILLTSGPGTSSQGMYWFTVISYALLGLIIFLWRRPYLKIFDNRLATRKWPRERVVSASEIEKITFLPGYVIIHFPGKQKRWVFSRIHMYPMQRMIDKLVEFANRNRVPVEVDPRMLKGE